LKILAFLVFRVAFRRFIRRRPHQQRDVGLRNGEAERINRRGKRRFAHPPPEPFAEFPPLKAQCRPYARLEKPFTLRRGEARPSPHRALEQISAPHLATFSNVVVVTRVMLEPTNR
jgi:hypothetical protein